MCRLTDYLNLYHFKKVSKKYNWIYKAKRTIYNWFYKKSHSTKPFFSSSSTEALPWRIQNRNYYLRNPLALRTYLCHPTSCRTSLSATNFFHRPIRLISPRDLLENFLIYVRILLHVKQYATKPLTNDN